jgi:hypothetical protein
METTGRLISAVPDYVSGKWHITFEIDTKPVNDINLLKGLEKLSIIVDKFREKRSRDANGLLWHCLSKIGQSMTPPVDKWDVYLDMLKSYGQFTDILVRADAVEATRKQWRETEEIDRFEIDGDEYVQLLAYFGSSTFNTKDFSVLLEGVIQEMKQTGLDAPTTKEMQRAIEMWEKQHEKTI